MLQVMAISIHLDLPKDCRTSALPYRHLVFIHDAVASLIQRVGVTHLMVMLMVMMGD